MAKKIIYLPDTRVNVQYNGTGTVVVDNGITYKNGKVQSDLGVDVKLDESGEIVSCAHAQLGVVTTKQILVVDDLRTFNFEARYARTVGEFQNIFPNYWAMSPYFDEVWLDHDMGEGGDVIELVNYIEQMAAYGDRLPIDTFVIHSSNPVGRERMKVALEKYYNVRMVRAEDYL